MALGIAGSCLYGAVMGGYGFNAAQVIYSGLKAPMLLALATLLCLPNFFVINTALGLRDDFHLAFRGILSTQVAIALCLASLSPVLLFSYACDIAYPAAKVLNGLFFAGASLGGQLMLREHYGPLIKKNPRHRTALTGWLLLYVFVAIQLAWVLRPFIGQPDLPAQFLRKNAWGNAYIEVFNAISRTLGNWIQ